MLLAGLDLLLALGLTLRLTRLVTTDHLGQWFVLNKAWWWAGWSVGREEIPPEGYEVKELGWKGRLVTGLQCCFCIGFWIGCAVLASLAIAGGPGEAGTLWRYIAGAFTLNYVAGHIGAKAD